MQSLPSYIKDASDALWLIDNFRCGPSANKTLLIMDVKSLCTSTPHADSSVALKVMVKTLRYHPQPLFVLQRYF